MDVHKDSVTACVLLIDKDGEFREQKRCFSTMTHGLKEMAAWLAGLEVEAIAMEATGVYWKPVWNILEAEQKFRLLLVNAHHIKQVPGRKTDQKDAALIADLLHHGLLKGSFVPPVIRRLRDLTRTRVKIRQMLASFANRIQKVLEDANIKLRSVASDVHGVSGGICCTPWWKGNRTPNSWLNWPRGDCGRSWEICSWPWRGRSRITTVFN
jgi:transposase